MTSQLNGTTNGASPQTFKILVLPGDHVGPEVMTEALKVFQIVQDHLAPKITFQLDHDIVGGCSIDKHGVPVTDAVLQKAKESDAVLFGSVGGPEWGTKQPNPESGLLKLRQHIDAFANIRPCTFYSQSLLPLSPLKPEIASGTNFILLRENTGGAYFGPKVENEDYASDTWEYTTSQIERCCHVAASLSHTMSQTTQQPAPITSADKANVLASSRLWRRVTTSVFARDYPNLELKHQLADSLSLLMVKAPTLFNGIIHTDNTFGDMLSDQAGGIVGTLGVLPSASLCGVPGPGKRCNGIYEPVHGSAPDIAGQGKVNPVAMVLSLALMLRYSFDLNDIAVRIESAVEKCLDSKEIGGLGVRTGDLGGQAGTEEMGEKICGVLNDILKSEGAIEH